MAPSFRSQNADCFDLLLEDVVSRRKFPTNAGAGALRTTCTLLALCLPALSALADEGCEGDYVCIADDPAAATAWAAGRGAILSGHKQASYTGRERCPEALADVTAASSDERRLACSAAGDALQMLGRCGIYLRRPLHLQIMSEVRHPFGNSPIFGLFDTKQDRVLVTQEANIQYLVKDTPYAQLPQRDFYRSLIVHEVVHGIMHQNLKWQPASHAAYEYPAYALQIASLPSSVRDKFLRSIPNRARPSEFVLNDTILFRPVLLCCPRLRAFQGITRWLRTTYGALGRRGRLHPNATALIGLCLTGPKASEPSSIYARQRTSLMTAHEQPFDAPAAAKPAPQLSGWIVCATLRVWTWASTCADYWSGAAMYEHLAQLSDAELARHGLSRATLAHDLCATCERDAKP